MLSKHLSSKDKLAFSDSYSPGVTFLAPNYSSSPTIFSANDYATSPGAGRFFPSTLFAAGEMAT